MYIEPCMLVMAESVRHIRRSRIEGQVKPDAGEIEIKISTPKTREGRQGVDRLVEIIKKILTRKTKKKVMENLHVATGYGLCLMESGLVERESIETLNAAAVEIADDMIGRIERGEKEDRRSESKIKNNDK